MKNFLVLGVLLVTTGYAWAVDESLWGEAKGGLATRLSLVTESPALGQPLRIRLEVKNVGTVAASYDSQQAATNGSLIVDGANGEAVPYIGGSYQTMGGRKTLQPGDSKTIFADLDVAAQYLIEKSGQFTIQTRSRGDLPQSNLLTVTVRPGTLSDFNKLFIALHRATPKDWRIANYNGSIVFLSTPTGLKADAASITLMLLKDPTGGPKPQRGQPPAVNLGETTLGQAWLMAESKTAIERWPEYEKIIAEQLKAFKKGS